MKKLLILTLICFTIFGCSSDDTNDNYSKYITNDSIATDINFMPEQVYSNSNKTEPPILKLKLITEKQFLCINYSLVTTQFIDGNEFIIRFDEIIAPEVCLTASGPAISYIDLPENISKITFINGDIIDKYSIEISQEKISILQIEKNFTNYLYNKTFRIPEKSFAYVCGTNTDNTYIYKDFSAIIEGNPNFVEF